MKSNYRKLGEYIKSVSIRNKSLENTNLIGLSIEKKFIPSISNTIGTDMSTYRILKHNQFAYCAVTSRNGEKVTIAHYQKNQDAIISQAYDIFDIVDKNKLNPEYLMMWFRRPEFDRYARFKSHGSVREMFEWEELCETLIPVPSIEKQREIVNEYNVIQDRIKLNEQIIQKLEETAQAIYKQWFVEFEFPNEEGKPYKSNGGEMVWNEELSKEIPIGWELMELKHIIDNFDSMRIPLSGEERDKRKKIYPYYGAASLMDYIDEFIFDGSYILLGEDGTVVTENGTPVLQYVWGKFWVNNHAHVLKGKNGYNENSLYLFLKNTNITNIITGGVQFKINQSNLNTIPILYSSYYILNKFHTFIDPIFISFKNKKNENQKLDELKEILLSKLSTLEGLEG